MTKSPILIRVSTGHRPPKRLLRGAPEGYVPHQQLVDQPGCFSQLGCSISEGVLYHSWIYVYIYVYIYICMYIYCKGSIHIYIYSNIDVFVYCSSFFLGGGLVYLFMLFGQSPCCCRGVKAAHFWDHGNDLGKIQCAVLKNNPTRGSGVF